MKISSKQAWEVLEISNHYWVETMKKHGDGDVDLAAFTHMIAFKLGTAIHDVVNGVIVEALEEGTNDAIPEPTPEVEAEADEMRVVH